MSGIEVDSPALALNRVVRDLEVCLAVIAPIGRPIGVTTVELVAVEGYKLRVRGLDAFEGSPIVDNKSA